MSKAALDNFNMQKHYIITRPKPISDLVEDDMFFDRLDFKLREKARRLQARRWRRLRHQWV